MKIGVGLKLKILLCTTSLIKAGTQRVVSNLANYLSNKHEIIIMTCTNCQIEYKLNDSIRIIKLDSKKENAYRSKNKFYKYVVKPIRVIRRTIKMRKEIEHIEPDIIVSFLPEPSFLVLINKRFNKKKVIVSVRNDPTIEYKSKIYNWAMRKLYPKANGFVFMTKEGKYYFKDIINCKTKIIPNAVNKDFIDNRYTGKRKKEIVSVGRLTKQKNFECLIKAFSKLDSEFNEYKLIIYGEGEERKKLENLIENLNLQDRVFLPGIEQNIKSKIYNASIFALPSIYEGISNALIEALALGVPTIATDSSGGGSRSLIEDNVNGRLIEVNNIEVLKQAMEEMLLNPEKSEKIGIEASKISRKLAPEVIYKKWEDFIEEIGEQDEFENNII